MSSEKLKHDISALYLEKQVCFPLYAASRLTIRLYTPYLEKLELTYPQYLVMLVLWQYREQSVSEVGQKLMLETNTLTPLLKRMEQKGWIIRKRSKTDERKVNLALTSKGESLQIEAAAIPHAILSAFESTSVSIEDIETFKRVLKLLIDTIQPPIEPK